MADDWRYNYFNKTNETDLWIREAYFVNDAGNFDFWTQSAYHRVFGLYVKRMLKRGQKGESIFTFKLTASMKSNLTNDFHQYLMYWPLNTNYPSRLHKYYYDDQGQRLRLYSKQTGYARECMFYQTITSMLVIGVRIPGVANNPTQQQQQQSTQIETDYNNWLYFHQTARPQLGQHVYLSKEAHISTIYISFILLPPTTTTGQQQQRLYDYEVMQTNSVCAIFPTIRNEWYDRDPNTGEWTEKKRSGGKSIIMTRQVFTMGLAFRRFGRKGESLIFLIRNPRSGHLREPNSSEKPMNTFYWNNSKDNRNDNRLYTRFTGESNWHNYGGAYDLTQQLFDDIRDDYDDDNNNNNSAQLAAVGAVGGPNQALTKNTVFAVYLCAGAKLIVIDSYHKDLNNKHHNRSLFEQGSVVIVEDQLWMTVPYNTKPDTLLDVLMNWSEFCNRYMTTEMAERVKEFENPVLFLGANDSDYNTSAWNLTIDYMGKEVDIKNRKKNNLVAFERRCYLEIPEGGYIVGVEDWADGIREIEYRHKYEQLHRAIVRHEMPERTRFTGPHAYELPPGEVWLNKIILNSNTDIITVVDRNTGQPTQRPVTYQRDIHIDIVAQTPEISEAYIELMGPYFNQEDHTIHPKEFNFSRFAELPPDPMNPVNSELMKTYRVSPAAYPPVKIQTSQSGDNYRLFYLPQNIRFTVQLYDGQEVVDWNLLTVFKNYAMDPIRYSTKDNNTNIYPTNVFNANCPIILKLSQTKYPFKEYEWKCLNNPFTRKHLIENDENIRLGIDGHFYELVENLSNSQPEAGPTPIGYIQSYYYELFDRRTGDKIVDNFTFIEENFEKPDNGFDEITDNQLYDLVNNNPNGVLSFGPNPWESSGSGNQSVQSIQPQGGSGSNTNQFAGSCGTQTSTSGKPSTQTRPSGKPSGQPGGSGNQSGQYRQSRGGNGPNKNQFTGRSGLQQGNSSGGSGSANQTRGQSRQSQGSRAGTSGYQTTYGQQTGGSRTAGQQQQRQQRQQHHNPPPPPVSPIVDSEGFTVVENRKEKKERQYGSGGGCSDTNKFRGPGDGRGGSGGGGRGSGGSQQSSQNTCRGYRGGGGQSSRSRGGGGSNTHQSPGDDGSQQSGQNTGRYNRRGDQYRQSRGNGGSNANQFQGYRGSPQSGQNTGRDYQRGGQYRQSRGSGGFNTNQSPGDDGSQQSGQNTGRSNRGGRGQYRQNRSGDGSQQSGQKHW